MATKIVEELVRRALEIDEETLQLRTSEDEGGDWSQCEEKKKEWFALFSTLENPGEYQELGDLLDGSLRLLTQRAC
ncbi:hypothetical protein COY93_02870 [Candidatus Uhrbacteria bacterium CG_4_10_14_0_8_um_filter_58_22]|uniref:Uncharacterized protein n=1 Tax=Candidatus Uhrbacteria bacterium CG_4_10_14_0_8_um_filter_58_22 TaxID=1975029 RepID=A0A2M7QAT5_9BACT|nr:MAG: hypothetical protein AUJ19_02065 [Parcubacteria group bacterium CG1_02_58_44]PIY62566.1 MAG: hypothetical protein COY93_02870 [Candidatus Uhrbacteria bacterium CG_4_10_14_0_8_um_filter_58_22]